MGDVSSKLDIRLGRLISSFISQPSTFPKKVGDVTIRLHGIDSHLRLLASIELDPANGAFPDLLYIPLHDGAEIAEESINVCLCKSLCETADEDARIHGETRRRNRRSVLGMRVIHP